MISAVTAPRIAAIQNCGRQPGNSGNVCAATAVDISAPMVKASDTHAYTMARPMRGVRSREAACTAGFMPAIRKLPAMASAASA
jgi:hypothetical protein